MLRGGGDSVLPVKNSKLFHEVPGKNDMYRYLVLKSDTEIRNTKFHSRMMEKHFEKLEQF